MNKLLINRQIKLDRSIDLHVSNSSLHNARNKRIIIVAIEHWSHRLWEPFSFATLLRWERGMPWVYARYGKHRWFPGDGSRTFRTYETWTRHVNALRAPCNRVYRDKRCLLNHWSFSSFFSFFYKLCKIKD